MGWQSVLDPSRYQAQLTDPSFLKGRAPGIITKEVVDPQKRAVSTPMAKYLASEVGKGLPRYPGDLSAPLPEGGERALSDFLALDPGDWYQKAVADPAMKEFKEELLPIIREGYAGSLRGSGRFRAEEAGISELTEMLAQGRYIAERDIPGQQFAMATKYKELQDINLAREYSDWAKSLPQASPVLGQALQYLQESTSTGTTILAALDPGQKGGWADLLMAGIQLEIAETQKPAPTGFVEAFYAGQLG